MIRPASSTAPRSRRASSSSLPHDARADHERRAGPPQASSPPRGAGAVPRDLGADVSALLEVRDLRTHCATDDGEFPAVDGVGFTVDAGKTLAIVGESGCGTSPMIDSAVTLLPQPDSIM